MRVLPKIIRKNAKKQIRVLFPFLLLFYYFPVIIFWDENFIIFVGTIRQWRQKNLISKLSTRRQISLAMMIGAIIEVKRLHHSLTNPISFDFFSPFSLSSFFSYQFYLFIRSLNNLIFSFFVCEIAQKLGGLEWRKMEKLNLLFTASSSDRRMDNCCLQSLPFILSQSINPSLKNAIHQFFSQAVNIVSTSPLRKAFTVKPKPSSSLSSVDNDEKRVRGIWKLL